MSYTEPPFYYLETYREFLIYYDSTHSTSADYRGYNPNTYQKPDGTYFGAASVAGVTLADAKFAIDQWYVMNFPSENGKVEPTNNLWILALVILFVLIAGAYTFLRKKTKKAKT
jgi:hypothetical protein